MIRNSERDSNCMRTVIHSNTNRTRCKVITLIETSALSLRRTTTLRKLTIIIQLVAVNSEGKVDMAVLS